MGDWKTRMQSASFRGVPFRVESESGTAGRRKQVFEYPQRDEPLVEDLGCKPRDIKLTAFVVGADCLEQRDKLLDALNAPGPGELIHPWFGSMDVEITEVGWSHSTKEGGLVKFDIGCMRAGVVAFPSATANTGKQLSMLADLLYVGALDRFSSAMDLIDLAGAYVDQVQAGIDGAFGMLDQVMGPITGALGGLESIASMALGAPGAFGAKLLGSFAGLRGAFSGFSSLLSGLRGKSGAVRSLAPASSASSPASSVTPSQQVSQAVVELVRDALVSDVMRDVAEAPVISPTPSVSRPVIPSIDLQVVVDPVRPETPVADEVVDVATGIDDTLWQVQLTADDPGRYRQLAQARQRLAAHLDAVASQGVLLVSYTPPAVLPALVLAYDRYEDAGRDGEIVARNQLARPGFVPVRELKLAQT